MDDEIKNVNSNFEPQYKPMGFRSRLKFNTKLLQTPIIIFFIFFLIGAYLQIHEYKTNSYKEYNINLFAIFLQSLIISIFVNALVVLPINCKKMIDSNNNPTRIVSTKYGKINNRAWLKYWAYIFTSFMLNLIIFSIGLSSNENLFINIASGTVAFLPVLILISHLYILINNNRQSIFDYLFKIKYEQQVFN
jgi:hypothetical protein